MPGKEALWEKLSSGSCCHLIVRPDVIIVRMFLLYVSWSCCCHAEKWGEGTVGTNVRLSGQRGPSSLKYKKDRGVSTCTFFLPYHPFIYFPLVFTHFPLPLVPAHTSCPSVQLLTSPSLHPAHSYTHNGVAPPFIRVCAAPHKLPAYQQQQRQPPQSPASQPRHRNIPTPDLDDRYCSRGRPSLA